MEIWQNVVAAREDFLLNHSEPLKFSGATVDKCNLTVDLESRDLAIAPASSWVVEGYPLNVLTYLSSNENEAYFTSSRNLPRYKDAGKLIPSLGDNGPSLRRQKQAIAKFEAREPGTESIARVLQDPQNAERNDNFTLEEFHDANLDQSKRDAVLMAMQSKDLCVVQGPPGTGKTTFIAELIQQFAREHGPRSRILLVSQTHVALDNALERLEKSGYSSLLRVGRHEKVSPRTAHLLLDKKLATWAKDVATKCGENFALMLEGDAFDPKVVDKMLLLLDLEESLTERHAQNNPSGLKTTLAIQIDELLEEGARFNIGKELGAGSQEIMEDLAKFGLDEALLKQKAEAGAIRSLIDAEIKGDADLKRHIYLKRMQRDWLRKFRFDIGLQKAVVEQTTVVAGTCIGFIADQYVRDMEFDLCIIDEASKATATEMLVPLSRSKRAVMVGDTNQLPPMDDQLLREPEVLKRNNLTKEQVQKTLFEELSQELPEELRTMLTVQYRMVPEIGNLISECFYENKLESYPRSTPQTTLELIGTNVQWLNTNSNENRGELPSGKGSYQNPFEAKVIVRKINEFTSLWASGALSDQYPDIPDVLVIAPYEQQVRLLRQELKRAGQLTSNVRVETFDAVQGVESDVVFVSVTRSNERKSFGFIGPDYWRRLNVALSRARNSLFIVGDLQFIRQRRGGLEKVVSYIEANHGTCSIVEAKI